MLITRQVEFSASHVCAQAGLSAEENFQLYGPASNPYGHGHNYLLEVTLEGDPDPVTGMVFDLKAMKDILNRLVVEPMDHRSLNHEVQPFDKIVPTAENVAMELWKRLAPEFRGAQARLHKLRLYESNDLWVDYFGERD